MLGLVADLTTITLFLALLIALTAGIVKGAVGFAMPLIIMSGLSSLMDPKFALAAIIIPIVVSNLLQTFRQGIAPALDAIKEHWRYVLIVCVMIFVFAQLVPHIPSRTFYFVLGFPVVILAAIQLLGVSFTIKPNQKSWAEPLIAIISGAFGGLAGTWGPTTVLYLLAINTPKAKQVIIQGVVFGMGSFTILGAHIQSGILNAYTAPLSMMLLPIALFGMWIGFKIQDRLDQARFKQITLFVLVIAGLNLLRRGFFG
jgi:uncharacterized membrane protein YfcA